MTRSILIGGMACVLVMGTGAYGATVSGPIEFGGAGNSLTATGSLTGSLTVSGSGGAYTYDDANNVWLSETFTIPAQTVALGSDPDLVSLSSSPVGTMMADIDDATYVISQVTSVDVDLTGGGGGGGALTFDLDPVGLTVNLDAGGSTTVNLTGAGAFSPLKVIDAAGTLTSGIMADVLASAGPIPLGYLFNAAAEQTAANDPIVLGTPDPNIGAWYEYGIDGTVDLQDLTILFSETDSMTIDTFSGSNYPYYALTLNYDASGTATLVDIEGTLSGIGQIPEPTTLALLMAGIGGLWLRRRR